MPGKINNAFLSAYVLFRSFVSDLKKDERAMEIVQVVMLILVGVLAIAAIWGLLRPWLLATWGRVAEAGDKIV